VSSSEEVRVIERQDRAAPQIERVREEMAATGGRFGRSIRSDRAARRVGAIRERLVETRAAGDLDARPRDGSDGAVGWRAGPGSERAGL
jgi:hypothetical protein